jgi:hypothetical protein
MLRGRWSAGNGSPWGPAAVTPSKTGSTWSPAELFDSDPGYLDKVLASFVTVNLLVLLIGAVAWVLLRVDAR